MKGRVIASCKMEALYASVGTQKAGRPVLGPVSGNTVVRGKGRERFVGSAGSRDRRYNHTRYECGIGSNLSAETGPCQDVNPNQPGGALESSENATTDGKDAIRACSLQRRGCAHLKKSLAEEFLVYPNARFSNLPVLRVAVKELIVHIVSRLREGEDSSCDARSTRSPEGGRASAHAEIYGGVARAVVAADVGEEKPSTDFDVRFYIHEGCDFNHCRNIVEDYLLRKLQHTFQEFARADSRLVRLSYFQKQVVIGSSFSLLSFGNPMTGRNVDLEFCPTTGSSRNYFDDANAFVVPLPAHVLECSTPEAVQAKCLSGSFGDAVNFLLRQELVIQDPGSVVNGLTLYAHTLCVKGLTPLSLADENLYGRELAQSFFVQAMESKERGGDPLRLVRSFMRSHYSSQNLSAFVLSSQLSALLMGYGSLSADKVDALAPALAELVRTTAHLALEDAAAHGEGLESVLTIARFLAEPHSCPGAHANERSLFLQLQDNRTIRLLRLPLRFVDTSAVRSRAVALFSQAAREQRAEELLPGQAALIEILSRAVVVAEPKTVDVVEGAKLVSSPGTPDRHANAMLDVDAREPLRGARARFLGDEQCADVVQSAPGEDLLPLPVECLTGNPESPLVGVDAELPPEQSCPPREPSCPPSSGKKVRPSARVRACRERSVESVVSVDNASAGSEGGRRQGRGSTKKRRAHKGQEQEGSSRGAAAQAKQQQQQQQCRRELSYVASS